MAAITNVYAGFRKRTKHQGNNGFADFVSLVVNQFRKLPLAGESELFPRLYLIRRSVENKWFAASFAAMENDFVMAATGELIRLINYVDDINTTLRRIQASLYGMDADERKRLAESLRAADQRLRELLAEVEK